VAVTLLLAVVVFAQAKPAKPFTIFEATIPELRAAMEQRRATSREIVAQYLARIATFEDTLNAAITINPHALDEADARDRERAIGHVRGPLHGIPIAIKDNIHTTNMPTTGGALAFDGFVPPYEATVTRNLREGGAIIIAKTVMTELANYIAVGMPTNYSSLATFGFNPYDPRRDPRAKLADGRPVLATGGSSSGIGTAANFWAANVGTETSGSILSPANQNMLVGIKPTVGRVSRYGIIPITADQDTAGPLAKTVTDAAILLGVLESTAPDPHDSATSACARPPNGDYTRYLSSSALKGARIGVPRRYFYDPVTPPGEHEPRGGLDPSQAKVMDDAIAALRRQGAVVVDPADIPSVVAGQRDDNFLLWPLCGATGVGDHCSIVFNYGMKRDFSAWLSSLGSGAPVHALTELRAWNIAHRDRGTLKYGQALLDASDSIDLNRDRARYQADRANDVRLSATHGIDEIMQRAKLDALLFPGGTGAAIAAKPGYPSVIVPFGMVPNSGEPAFPPNFNPRPAPFGVTFTGSKCSEPRLIALAYAFEQATKRRIPPALK
jgi:amidase